MESHVAGLARHLSGDWVASIDMGSALQVTTCGILVIIGHIYLYDSGRKALFPDVTAQLGDRSESVSAPLVALPS